MSKRGFRKKSLRNKRQSDRLKEYSKARRMLSCMGRFEIMNSGGSIEEPEDIYEELLKHEAGRLFRFTYEDKFGKKKVVPLKLGEFSRGDIVYEVTCDGVRKLGSLLSKERVESGTLLICENGCAQQHLCVVEHWLSR